MKNSKGFTLLEVMITLAIISIIAVIAIPSYQNYTRKAHYSEIVQATAPYKLGVEECYQMNGKLDECEGGKAGIPKDFESDSENIASIVTKQGVVSVTPNEKNGLTPEDTYILTPNFKESRLLWTYSGGGVDAGYVR